MKHSTESIMGCNDLKCNRESLSHKSNHSENPQMTVNNLNNIVDEQNDEIILIKKPNQKNNNNSVINSKDFWDETLRELFKNYCKELPNNFKDLNNEERYKLTKDLVRQCFPNLPETLIEMTSATTVPGDDNISQEIPVWLDREKFARGQKFARDHLFGIFFAELISLFTLFSFEDGLKPMIITGKSSEPYTSFKRYLSTSSRVRNWYTSDPWSKGSAAYNDIQIVRKMHTNIRNSLMKSSLKSIDKARMIEKTWSPTKDLLIEDFKTACPAPLFGQCPYAMPETRKNRPKGLNQGEMAATQFGFVGLTILFPTAFGIHNATDDDLEAFCHVWKGIGYLLGIKDEFNFCRGSLKNIKQRSRDFLNIWVKPNFREITPEWEHMMRCVIEGLQYYFPGTSYETALLFLTELMDLEMPKLRAFIPYKYRMRHNWIKIIFKYPCKSTMIKSLLNKRINRCMDQALIFDIEHHNKLKKLSDETMARVLNSKIDKSSEKIIDNKRKSFQYKLMGIFILILFTQFSLFSKMNIYLQAINK